MKQIQVTPEDSEIIINEAASSILAELKKRLTEGKTLGDFVYRYSLKPKTLEKKIQVIFTPLAYLKMRELVNTCTDEIAWHGVVKASEDRKTFTITDILVYPQTVSGATVCTDEVAYEKWHQRLDDEQYNNLRFQGHSHVNMGTSPSTVDTNLYESMLHTLSADSYYIFMITNKSGAHWTNVYDLAANAIYESSDITVSIDGFPNDWYRDNYTKQITRRVWSYQTAGITGGAIEAGIARGYYDTTKGSKKTETERKLSKKEEKEIKKQEALLKDAFYAADGPAKNYIVDESDEYYGDNYMDIHHFRT